MNFTLEMAEDRLAVMLPSYAAAIEKSLPHAIRQAARGVTKRVINITPPASAGVTGGAARRQGELKIHADMLRVFTPKTLKGHRQITVVFGHKIATPVTVVAKELWPDLRTTYRNARHGTAGRIGFRTSRQYLVVDGHKFDELQAEKRARVGLLASAWMASAAALGVNVPAWIVRHGTARGAYREKFGTDKPYVEIAGNLPPGVPASLGIAMHRLLNYAVNYQLAAMTRQVRYLLAQKGVESGFTHVGAMPPPPIDIDVSQAA